MTQSSRFRFLTTLWVVAAFGLGAALSGAVGQTKQAPTAIRNALAETDHVQGAPDRTLVLGRVTVEPGAELARRDASERANGSLSSPPTSIRPQTGARHRS